MKRYGSVIRLKPSQLKSYKRYHAKVWPGILRTIRKCHIRNYSIYLRKLDDGKYYLFSYFEYHGKDMAADAAKMAADPLTQKWWAIMKPMQVPLKSRRKGEWWADMVEVFHMN